MGPLDTTEVPTLESNSGPAQTEALAMALRAAGFRAEAIVNAVDEPVAVHVSAIFTAEDVQPVVEAVLPNADDELARIRNPELGHVLPYGMRSGLVYPAAVCRLMDVVVQTITGRDDVLAARLNGAEGGLAAGIGDAHPHTDFPGSVEDPDPTQVHGLNVHVTLSGRGTVRFSTVRSFAQVREIAEGIQRAQHAGRSIIEINETFPTVYADVMSLASRPVQHVTGDVLLFQARPHPGKGLLPIAHHFESHTADRMVNVFVPKADDGADIAARRLVMIERYRLHRLGYAGSARHRADPALSIEPTGFDQRRFVQ